MDKQTAQSKALKAKMGKTNKTSSGRLNDYAAMDAQEAKYRALAKAKKNRPIL